VTDSRVVRQNVYGVAASGITHEMDRPEWGPELVAVVNRRLDVMAALEQSRAKRDLLADLEVSRSTLDRAVRELESLGLVSRGEGYHLTVTGRLVLELYRGLLADLDDVAAARELLGSLSRDAPVDPAMLRGARVEVAENPAPAAVLDPVFDRLEDARRLRVFSVARSRPDYTDRTREQLVDEGVELEVVYSRPVLEFLLENREWYPEALEGAAVDRYVRESLPYGLTIATLPDDRFVALVVYDEASRPRGVVVNDTPAACRWADEVFERYRETAEPLEP
jgi:predicted transcriptional regulator